MSGRSSVAWENEHASLVLSGELTHLQLNDDFYRLLLDECGLDTNAIEQALVVRFEEVSKLDTSLLAWLLNLKRWLASFNISVTLESPPDQLVRLAQLSNVAPLLELE